MVIYIHVSILYICRLSPSSASRRSGAHRQSEAELKSECGILVFSSVVGDFTRGSCFKPLGSNLILDDVRDVNKAQPINFLAQSGPVRTAVVVGRVGPQAQTSEFLNQT